MAETYYGTAGKDAQAGLARILEATKQAGKAGQDAYNEAASGMDIRQKQALTQAGGADAFIGGGSTLFKDRAVGQDARFRNALDTARTGYTQGLEGTKASATSYFEKLRAALPALQAQNSQLLSSKEASLAGRQQKAKQSEEKTKIIGETQAELDKLLAERETLSKQQPIEKAGDASWAPGGFNAKPLETQIAANQKRMQELTSVKGEGFSGGTGKIPVSVLATANPAQYTGKVRSAIEEYQHLASRNARFQGALDKQRAPSTGLTSAMTPLPAGIAGPVLPARPKDRLVEVEKRIAELQSQQQRPSDISNRIAVDKYKWDPAFAKGTFTDALWRPMTDATGKTLAPELSPMAASLAAKGDVLLGADEIQSILDQGTTATALTQAQKDSAAGSMTFSEADKNLREDFLDPDSENYSPETYQVLKAILKGYSWKPEKR